jgi:ATP-binding cassette subfamily B multidrug efflux pump
VQQVQMLVLMTCTLLVAAPIMCVGGIVMALREDVGLSWLPRWSRAGAGHRAIGLIVTRMVPQFRRMQERIDRSTGCCASRSPASGWCAPSCASPHERRALRRGQRRPHRHRAAGRPADGADVPDRDARAQRVERRGALVRRHRIDAGEMQIGALTRSSATSCRS